MGRRRADMDMRRAYGWLFVAVWLSACRPASGHDLSVDQLTAVVAREQGSLDPCYQTALDKNPYHHEFQIQTTLHIRKDGSVAKVGLDQQGLQGIGPCIEAAIRAWKFPSAQAETHAKLPIIFRPKVVTSLPADLKLPPGFKVLEGPE
jgi:hypothetical protein